MKKNALIIGLGYVGLNLARKFSSLGWKIAGTSRNSEKLKGLNGLISIPLLWNENFLESFKKLNWKPAVIIITVGPSSKNIDPILNIILPYIKNYKGWLGYISATSVYGGKNGLTVDEKYPCKPNTRRGEVRLKSETLWHNLGAEIFRVSSIYGPKRSPYLSLKNNKAIVINRPEFLFNRIHISDLINIIFLCINHPRQGRICNVSDGNPSSQVSYYKKAAALSGYKMPDLVNFEDAQLSEKRMSFWYSWKYVIPMIVISELNYKFIFPDYKVGLASIWEEEK